jgi:hypothetical protein
MSNTAPCKLALHEPSLVASTRSQRHSSPDSDCRLRRQSESGEGGWGASCTNEKTHSPVSKLTGVVDRAAVQALAAKGVEHSAKIISESFSRCLKAVHQRMPGKVVEHAGVQALAAKHLYHSTKFILESFSRRLKAEHQRIPSKIVGRAGVQALAAKHISLNESHSCVIHSAPKGCTPAHARQHRSLPIRKFS